MLAAYDASRFHGPTEAREAVTITLEYWATPAPWVDADSSLPPRVTRTRFADACTMTESIPGWLEVTTTCLSWRVIARRTNPTGCDALLRGVSASTRGHHFAAPTRGLISMPLPPPFGQREYRLFIAFILVGLMWTSLSVVRDLGSI